MPRAKVDDSHRKRALQACTPCKVSKKRCDCQVPCQNCVKRKTPADCVYNEDLPRIPGKVKPRSGSASTASPSAQRAEPPRQRTSDGPNTAVNMLWTSRGTQVYVGSSASLSFLTLLRDTLNKHMGRSAFTDDAKRSLMLETRQGVAHYDPDLECPHSSQDMAVLIETYFAATSGIIDVLSKEEIVNHLDPTTGSNRMVLQSNRDAIIHMVFAIGAQCRGSGLQDQQCERVHLAKAQKRAFDGFLDTIDVDLVRLFILMAFYMFGACRRNTAFMYIGIAARASNALGIHHEEAYRSITNQAEGTARLKTWKSVRILDLLVAALLGRSPVTSDVETAALAQPDEVQDNDDIHRRLCLDASYQAWTTIDEIVQQLFRKGASDRAIAKRFLNDLTNWSANLSPNLRSNPPPGMSKLHEQEYIIGNVHVACSYYYSVLITTRKFLVTHLSRVLSQMPSRNPSVTPLEGALPHAPAEDDAVLAQTCIESALLTLQTCRDVFNASMLLPNMAILKAFIFSAGMIIGFAMFADPKHDPNLEQAYLGGCAVLQHLATLSPQAKQYLDILDALHNAIKEHHHRRKSIAPIEESPLVTKIFKFGSDPVTETVLQTPMGSVDSADWTAPTVDQMDDQGSQYAEFAGFGAGLDAELSFNNMDPMAIQLWDELLLGQECL